MKHLLLLISMATVMVGCTRYHGSGNLITKTFDVGQFKGVETGGVFEVELTAGSEYKVEVEADDNLMKLVQVKVSGDVLEISTRNAMISDGHFKARVTMPSVAFIKASGAAQVTGMNQLKSDDRIKIYVSGAAHVNADLDAPKIVADASGAGGIRLEGRCREFSAQASGSADIDAQDLKSERSAVDASGAAEVHVFSSVSVKAEASGSSTVYYNGGGVPSSNTSGAATVKPE